ncbi:MAG: acyl-CoA dehydrogenase family protein [Candidatus Binatia bacterium]|nr:acyl-CoA dehydrogenase family protein [Candidatus Binatia bacterium]HAC79586.1 acyl-CoA dehydrogenase [Deltaproteobacteria bacterium]
MASSPTDYYDIDDLLSTEERQVQATIRRFVDEEYLPVVRKHFDAGTFPTELTPRLAELGCFGPTVPVEYGGAGLNSVCYGLMAQELERGDSGLRSYASVQSSLCMYPILTFGTEEQKQRWLPAMARGEAIGCFGLTEPDYGSNPGGMITRATRQDGGFVLNGTKRWITNGSIADIAIVWAKLEEDGRDTIRGFLVEKERSGFERPLMHGKWSLRASITSELIFEDCFIPEENLLPASGGLKSPLLCLTQARYGISWGAIGAALACYESALDYAKSRTVFAKPIGGYQLVQAKLVEMLAEITKAQLLSWRLGRLKDSGKMRHEQVSLAKMNNVSWALKIARNARDIHGANGITDDYPIMRHMMNLETVNTYEGTEDIHRLTLGRDITGLGAFE